MLFKLRKSAVLPHLQLFEFQSFPKSSWLAKAPADIVENMSTWRSPLMRVGGMDQRLAPSVSNVFVYCWFEPMTKQ